jgi:hypothetical protein
MPPKLQPDQGRGRAGIPALLVQPLQTVCLRVNKKDADGAGNACGNPP